MGVWQKVIAGGPDRKTRLHDHHGNRVSFDRITRNGPRAVASTFSRVAFGTFIKTPWISYDGQALIDRRLKPHSRVLEFGSGASTGWFADRAGFVLSHEHDAKWFNEVDGIIGNRPNVVRTLHDDVESYIGVEPEYHEPFDLILVDGWHRDRCVESALPLLARGGILYLDNSDKSECPISGDVPRARRMLFYYAASNGKEIRSIVDFVAAQLFASEAVVLFN